ncbi:sensor domain-containing diguanylate cyclase [Paenibacillus sp. 2TAB19]|uniref:sensor domain-containing diguanylate cyclase n=1 Tax=Paenibacillus sp. 2TAB19 TaxID=3233003 RepID=UPI003F9521E8
MDIQLETAPCGYFSILDTGIVQSVNQTLLNMLLLKRDELLGRHIETTMSVTNKLFFHTYFYPYIQINGHVNEMYLSFRTSDNQEVPVLLNGVRQERGGQTVIDCVVVMMRKRIEHEKDVLQTKERLEHLYQATNEANKQLERLHEEYETKQQELMRINHELEVKASTDPLTGLRNRRYFQESLQKLIAEYQETRQPLSLLIIDIDHFKHINDTYGHPVGDLVLSGLARLLQRLSREGDVLARFGGEEFVALLPGVEQDEAIVIADNICRTVAKTPLDNYQITISIGISTVTDTDTEQTLLHQADLALYQSKAGGRNRVTHAAHSAES